MFFRRGDALSDAISAALKAAEAHADKMGEKSEQATLTASIAELHHRNGDDAAAGATRQKALARARALPSDLSETLCSIAASIALSGDRASADALLEAVKQKAAREEILGQGMLAEVSEALHKLGDDKAARELTRKLLEASQPGAQKPDEIRFQLAVHNLAVFGDPDGAEALLPKVAASERWPTLREIARVRGKTDKARGAAALKRSVSAWMATKDRFPSHAMGLVDVMGQLGQTTEAKAFIESLSRLFPKASDRDEVLRSQAYSYGLLKHFPQALAAAAKIKSKSVRSSAYTELADTALVANDLAAYDRIIGLALPGIPAGERPSLTFFFIGLRAALLARLGRRDEAAVALKTAMEGLEKAGARGGAGLLSIICESVLTPLRK